MTPARSGIPSPHAQRPLNVLMTVDAVGGVWRYAMDLAEALRPHGVETTFVGFGPAPSTDMLQEAQAIGRLVWCDMPLDWMAESAAELEAIPSLLGELVGQYGVDLVHLNLPSQACGLALDVPVVTVSHSCVTTWFAAVRGTPVPEDWRWQERCNLEGLQTSDAVIAPSESHADALRRAYGFDRIAVVPNCCRDLAYREEREDFVFAAGRWWDEGKNGAVLDQAAADCGWPVVMAGACHGPNGQELEIRHAQHRGALGHAETMALMQRAAIFVSPSIYEPFGLASLEAARSGAALVLADIPTYRELWDGVALFADPADPLAFAYAIDRLATDRQFRLAMARKARQRAAGFTAERQANAMLGIYDSVLPSMSSLSAAE